MHSEKRIQSGNNQNNYESNNYDKSNDSDNSKQSNDSNNTDNFEDSDNAEKSENSAQSDNSGKSEKSDNSDDSDRLQYGKTLPQKHQLGLKISISATRFEIGLQPHYIQNGNWISNCIYKRNYPPPQ